MKSLLMMLVITAINSCDAKRPATDTSAISTGKTILALGDSYTIGESVLKEQSFPYQLAKQLNADGIKTENPKVIAQTGWTTSDLLGAIESEKLTVKYDVVTLMIGVNNQYSGGSQETFRKEFNQLLDTAISHSKTGAAGVFVISFPDWTVTPFGREQGFKGPSAEVDTFNAISKQETAKREINYIDITPASRIAESDRSLIAGDGLHPSGKMYGEWVRAVYPLVKGHWK